MSQTPTSTDGLTTEFVNVFCQVGQSIEKPPEAAQPSQVIEQCAGCDQSLDWPAPRPSSWASARACPSCGRWSFADGQNESQNATLDPSLRSDETKWSDEAVTTIGAGDLIDHVLGAVGKSDEQRESYRRLLTLPLVGVPLSDQGQPICEAIAMTLCDISPSGTGLVTGRPFRAPYLVIDFSLAGRPGVQMLVKLVWQRLEHGALRFGCQAVNDPAAGLPLVAAPPNA